MLSPELNLSLMVIMTRLFSRSVSQLVCGTGWFGSDCKYKCWCAYDRCQADGQCLSSSYCIDPSFGPSCQYSNIMSSAITSDTWITDGRIDTCNLASTVITVDWDDSYHITWFRVFFGISVLPTNTTPALYFSFKNSSNYTEDCSYQRVFFLDPSTVDIHCDTSTRINQISLRGNDTLRICELRVSGGRNLALRQRTTQTSDYSYVGFTYTSDLAVDGFRNKFFSARSCTSTDDTDTHPSWSVYFSRSVIIYQAVLFNRNSNFMRLQNFTLKVFDVSGTLVEQYTNPGDVKLVNTVTFTMPRPVGKISIHVGLILTLCEVETYGDLICPKLKWGLDCLNDCNCKPSELCSPITGNCDTGCSPGLYDRICERNCPTNCLNKECFRDTGICVKCEKGYKGDSCDIECLPNTYGSDCLLTCHSNCRKRNCSNSASVCSQRVCDHDGMCLACNDIKNYGFNCTLECPKNCQFNPCDIINGTCYSCNTGFYGNLCSQVCSGNCKDGCELQSGFCNDCKSTFYGDNCATPCPITCPEHLCHAKNGTCSKACPTVFYGATCSYSCPKTCANQNCHDTNGTCAHGCETGLFGENCSEICPRRCEDRLCYMNNGTCLTCDIGFYGVTCDLPCSTSCDKRTCDINSGFCSEGGDTDYHMDVVAPIFTVFVLLLVAIFMLWTHSSQSGSEEKSRSYADKKVADQSDGFPEET